MELKISKQSLVELVRRAASATSAKSPMSMLACLRFSAEKNGTVRAIGTDIVLGITATTTAEVKTPGELLVNARQMLDIAKSLPAGDVTLASAKKEPRLELKSGKAKFKIPFLSVDEYPPVPTGDSKATVVSLASQDLSRCLSQVAYAQCLDDTRQHIACVFAEYVEGAITCASTEGHRLAVSSAPATYAGAKWAYSIPSRAVGDLRKLCDDFLGSDAMLSVVGTHLHAAWPGVSLCVKLGDEGQFPPYRKLVPKHTTRVTVLRTALFDAVKRLALIAKDKSSPIVAFTFNEGSLDLSAEDEAKGEATESVDCDHAGKSVAIGLDASYTVDALSAITDDDVTIEIGDALAPVVFRGSSNPDECMGLIMPARLAK